MTDAALAMTESAVEGFVESYLTALGADIRKDGRQWTVTLPEDADTDLELDGASLVVTNNPDEVDGDEIAVAPESAFVERLLDEATERNPVGSLELTGETVDVRLPPWLDESDVEVLDHSFTPYYDRKALCVLFHIGIETVSEYQSEELRAVALDLGGGDRLPALAETYLQLAEEGGERIESGTGLDAGDDGRVKDTLTEAREAVEHDVEPLVEDVRERATRAATVELEEYREYARQRLDELDDELDRLSERIEETTETVEATSEQGERVEALRERKELRRERDDLREEREELRAEMEADFPERRRKVRDRHSLTVRIRPVALAGVTFERGDLSLSVRDGDATAELSFAYGVGIGVTDAEHCGGCGARLDGSNPLALEGKSVVGANCCR
jgi:hypothetical protein